MRELVYTCKVLRKNTSNWLAFLGAMAVIFLVFLIVNNYIGNSKLPSVLQNTNIYFFLGFILFGASTAYIYFKGLIDFEIYKSGKSFSIEVMDEKLVTPLVINSPITISKQWYDRESGHRGVKMKELCLTISDRNNQPVLTIISVLGALHDAPYGWEYINLFNNEERKSILRAEHCYTNTKAEEISLELNSLMTVS